MAACLRPTPLLQELRSVKTSSDNGTVTPLPVPYTDFWDINSVPNAGLTLTYSVTNITEYQGRITYINKTQDTTGGTIQLTLPGGYSFSSTGNSTLVLPNEPAAFVLVFSTSSIVAVLNGKIEKINALPNRNSPDEYVSRISSTGQLYNSSVPYSRRATITGLTMPIGTADGTVFGGLFYTPSGIYGRVGDIIEFTYSSIAGFDDVGSETDLFIGGWLLPSIGGGVNLLKGTVCLTSLTGPTYKYTVTYNNTTTGTTRLYTGSFVGPAILSGLSTVLRTASFPATTVPLTIDFGFLQLNRLNQAV